MAKVVKDKLLFELSNIVIQLQDWIEDRDRLSSIPTAHLIWSCSQYQIRIGKCVVFDNTGDVEPSFEECKREYLEGISELLPFVKELPPDAQAN